MLPRSISMKRLASLAGTTVAALLLPFFAACRPRPPAGPLTVAQSSDILTLDPNARFEVTTDTVAMNIFDPLLRFDSHMTLQPALAVRWETPTDRVWRFHLRPGVRFHDGSALSTDDVVFTFQRVLKTPESELFSFLSGIQEVRAVDAETVDFVTAQPTSLLARVSVVYVMPRAAFERSGADAFFRRPVGTGPYSFVSRRPGESVELEAFPAYWGGRPAVRRVVFRAVESPQERWRLVAATRPTVLLDAPRLGWEEHRHDKRFRLVERPSLTVSYLGINCAPRPDNPLADVRVRRAIRAALDLKELVRIGTSNHAFPASQYVPPDVIGYNPELPLPTPDRAAARRLLAAAGHPDGLDLVLDHQASSTHPTVDEIIRQLAAVGIRVREQSWPTEALYDRIDHGLSQMHTSGWVCSSGESAELFQTSLHTRDSRSGLGRGNGLGYSNLELDRLTELIVATIDPGSRVELEKRAMAVALDDLPLVPLYIQEDRYAMTPDVLWEPRADGELWLPDVRLRGGS